MQANTVVKKTRRPGFKVTALEIPEQPVDDSFTVDQHGRYISESYIIGQSGVTKEKHGSSPDEKQDNDSGINLDELEILNVLGRGNSGVVHTARHTPTGKLMAVKMMNILEADNRHQLIKELKTLYKADCRNLIGFHDAFYKDPAIYLVLEYMSAGSLQRVLALAKKLPERVIACLARQVVEGLHYLHKRHQIHRDIKPSNICLNMEGEAKLMDFGITAQLQDTLAVCETFIGTYNYMSPERIRGGQYSYKSDIWSVGLCILECTLGRFPYPLTGVYLDLMQNIVSAPPAIPDHCSKDLRSFISCCLQIDPEKRSDAAGLLAHPFVASLTDMDDNAVQMSQFLKSTIPALPVSVPTATAVTPTMTPALLTQKTPPAPKKVVNQQKQ